MGKMQRRKGANAEREVAKLLCAWWQQLEPGVSFVKTPLSGGWSNAKVRGDMKASGDLMTNALTFPFTVEVKRREGYASHKVKPGILAASPVWSWWDQAEKQAAEQGGTPLLVFRASQEPWRILLPNTRKVWFAFLRREPTLDSPMQLGLMRDKNDRRVVLAPLQWLLSTNPHYWSTK